MSGFRTRLYACFALVYLVWGSSFLVIRIGVTDLPPLLFAAGRALIGGSVLLTLALYRGDHLPSTAHEWKLMCFFSIVLIAFIVERRLGIRGDSSEAERARQNGSLFAAGLITGEALMGIVIASPIV